MNLLGEVGAGHVLGRYELLMRIASGGMATVWAARLKGTRGFQKTVAIKTMLPSMSEDPQFEQMFLEEATLASKVRHPHVVEILDLGEDNGLLFIVMEWVDGEPLSILMRSAAKKGVPIPLSIGVRIAMQACAGLHAAHELRDDSQKLLGVVHRDVSPQNVLIGYDGVVKVVDFGVAKATAVASSASTSAGQIKGKAAYMSPEQARGANIDRRTDVFAMGILLYQLTTGRHPFRAENDVATLYNICSEAPVFAPSRIVRTIPPSLEMVILRALAKDVNRRYATANDLYSALDRVMLTDRANDEQVRGFVRGLLGDRQERRNEQLKNALRIADDRAAGRAVQAMSVLELTPGTGISAFGRSSLYGPPAEAGGTGARAIGGTMPTVMSGSLSQPGPTAVGPAIEVRPRGRRSLAVLTLLAAIFGGGLLAMRAQWFPSSGQSAAGPVDGVGPAPAASSVLVAVAAPSAAPPVAPGDPGRPSAGAPAPTESAAKLPVVPAVSVVRPPVRPPKQPDNPARPPSSPAAPHNVDPTFVPPVRDPGF